MTDAPSALPPDPPRAVVEPLLDWIRGELRDLPWRRTRDPWHVLVSETMLQQTQVSRVVDRYHEFVDRFPTPGACAAAPTAEVIELWAGLGYNRRAVNLWRCANVVVDEHDGDIPCDLAALLALPGVGPYTARAVLAFAFEDAVGVVDTNVGRLLARWGGTPLLPRHAQMTADALVPVDDAWIWNQGLFDFANAICTKRVPACERCPVSAICAWSRRGPDPARSSAGVSTPQSTFEGSERQVRGRIVDALRRGPVDTDRLAVFGRPTDGPEDLARIAAGLVADGLAERDGHRLRLPARSVEPKGRSGGSSGPRDAIHDDVNGA